MFAEKKTPAGPEEALVVESSNNKRKGKEIVFKNKTNRKKFKSIVEEYCAQLSSDESSVEQEQVKGSGQIEIYSDEELEVSEANTKEELEGLIGLFAFRVTRSKTLLQSANCLGAEFDELQKQFTQVVEELIETRAEVTRLKDRLQDESNRVRALDNIVRRPDEDRSKFYFPTCWSNEVQAACGVVSLSDRCKEAINRCFSSNSSSDWLDIYKEEAAVQDIPNLNIAEKVAWNIDRAQKLSLTIAKLEAAGDTEKIKEVIGLSRLEEKVGIRGHKIQVTLSIEPRVLPEVGEIFVIRRENTAVNHSGQLPSARVAQRNAWWHPTYQYWYYK